MISLKVTFKVNLEKSKDYDYYTAAT